jgi:aspartyl-tRNA(Asn)/glutamyl-tRNA(Gln) amidotransferase subunit C
MISPEEVKKVASLSRIHLREEELKSLTKDLEKILGYIDQLKKAEVDAIAPTSHALELKNVYRDDEPETPLPVAEVLKNAPDRDKSHFKVPKVIE